MAGYATRIADTVSRAACATIFRTPQQQQHRAKLPINFVIIRRFPTHAIIRVLSRSPRYLKVSSRWASCAPMSIIGKISYFYEQRIARRFGSIA
jgi:uncharacterized protein (DUF1330 family)